MRHTRTAVIAGILAGILILPGCRAKMSKVSQGLTPLAANFYVLHQELDRARQGVRSEAPAQIDARLTAYAGVTGQVRAMAAGLDAETELKKKAALRAAIDSSLAADSAFLALETQAVRLQAAVARLDIRIKGITQQARGNSFKMRQAKPELDKLNRERQQWRQALDKLLSELMPAAARCRAMLKQYNFIVAAEKIVDYFNAETIYDPFAWERPPARKATSKTARRK